MSDHFSLYRLQVLYSFATNMFLELWLVIRSAISVDNCVRTKVYSKLSNIVRD